jgi:hypothetical protein
LDIGKLSDLDLSITLLVCILVTTYRFGEDISDKRSASLSQNRGGFGGIRDRFDSIIPPDKIANISTGSIGLIRMSMLKVGWVICRLLLLEKTGPEGSEKNLQN